MSTNCTVFPIIPTGAKFSTTFQCVTYVLSALLIAFLFVQHSAIASNKTFIVTTEEWPPFISGKLSNNGWTMEVARAALEPEGYDVSLQLVPWARALKCSKSGKCDGLYLSYYVEERTQWYVFSDPVAKLETGLFKLKSSDISFDTLDDLRPYTIGMTRGAAVSDEFDRADFLKKVPVPHHTTNITKLLKGRLDLVVAAKPVFEYLIRSTLPEDQHDKFEFIEPHLSVQNLHMAISKNSPDYQQKLQDFNEGLRRIRADGTYDAIRRSHGY